jgi:hypothetical protein
MCQLDAMRSMTGWPVQPYKEHPSLPSAKPHKIFRAFIYGYNLTNIAITGGGIVHGHGVGTGGLCHAGTYPK